jgi:hypothetical protein
MRKLILGEENREGSSGPHIFEKKRKRYEVSKWTRRNVDMLKKCLIRIAQLHKEPASVRALVYRPEPEKAKTARSKCFGKSKKG